MPQKKNRSTNFLLHGSILAIAALITRVIGLLYRIPLINIVGSEGMAYYSSAFQIYNVILLISSYSMPTAISKMVSGRMAKKEFRNTARLFHLALLFAAVTGTFFGLLVFFGADWFAKWVLNLPLAAVAIRMLAPAIFIMAFLGVFRGFFQGLQTTIPTAFSQLFEQIINAIVSVAAAYYLFQLGNKADLLNGNSEYGPALGAAGGTLGTTIGALTALIFMLLVFLSFRKSFFRYARKDKKHVTESNKKMLQSLLVTILPIILSTAAYNIIDLVDNSIFGYYITRTSNASSYQKIWGTYTGMYMTLIHVPISFSSALAASLMPSITAAMAEKNRGEVITKINLAIKFAMLIAFPSAIGLAILAEPLMSLMFSSSGSVKDASLYLIMGSSSVVFMSLSTVTNAILQGINKMRSPVNHALISLCIHVAVMAVLLWVFDMGIYGVIFAYIVFAVSMCTLNTLTLNHALNVSQRWAKNYILPFLAAVVMGIATYAVRFGLEHLHMRNLVTVPLCLIVAVIVYAVFLFLFRAVDELELYDFPMGGRIVRLAKKLHLLKS